MSSPKKYDIEFQKSIIKLCISDFHFIQKITSYFDRFIIEAKENKREDKFIFFTSPELNMIYSGLAESVRKYSLPADPGFLRQFLRDSYSESEAISAIKLYENIKKTELNNELYYKKELESFIISILTLNTQIQVNEMWNKDISSVYKIWEKTNEEIKRISLGERPFKQISQVWEILESEETTFIPTGIPDFDDEKVLGGGLPIGDLSVAIGGSNSGKTMLMVNWATDWIKLGYKVYYVALDSRKGETTRRIMACLTGIPTRRIKKGKLSDGERDMLKKAEEKYSHLIRINEDIAYPASIEEFVVHAKGVHHEWGNEIFIVDYMTKMTSSKFHRDKRHEYGEIANHLRSLAKTTNTLVVSPVQPTRESQKIMNGTSTVKKRAEDYYLKMTDIAECQEIPNVAAVVITINATDEEQRENKRRLMVVKNREGEKNFPIGLITDLGSARMITGNYFNPEDVNVDMDFPDTSAANGSSAKNGKGIYLPQMEASNPDSLKKKLLDVDGKIGILDGKIAKIDGLYRDARQNSANDQAAALRKQIDDIEREKESLLIEANGLAKMIYGDVTMESIGLQTKSCEETKKSAKNQDEILKVRSLTKEIKLQKYALNRPSNNK